MDKKIEDKLYKQFPKLLRQHKLPMTETCLCWGLECGNGWEKLLTRLFSRLQFDIDRNDYPQIEFTQIKEKYGSGRFYHIGKETEYKRLVKDKGMDEREWDRKCGAQDAIINLFEDLAGETCEICGKMDGVKQTEGWIYTRCPKCMEELKEKRGLK